MFFNKISNARAPFLFRNQCKLIKLSDNSCGYTPAHGLYARNAKNK